ncbi:ANTAR domain-containing protein [Streptomyces afghaniensis]|uniref:ANTAR domain-containing protein n=1 Tax=Streptomyces afghaniensis TaxID=66865 RepID=UPI00278A4B2E|nr:ANTAR domain-containing protein [Streptomyces afghaniensis]MDQ1015305.1 anti-anti-sigma factor [Streptomyces afghaniensis]
MPDPAQPVTAIPPCMATMDVAPDGDRMTVTVWGELDLGSRRLLPDLYDILTLSGRGIDLCLDAVGFCDCSGLNMLLDLRLRALDEGKTVAVRSSGRAVERLLDLTGTRELFAAPAPKQDGVRPAADGEPGPETADDRELRAEVTQLRRAMQTRPTIDLARGILMASFGLSPEGAWSVLVRTSQNTNTKLHHLARDLVGTVHGSTLPESVQQQLAAAVASTAARSGAAACPASGPAEDGD